MGEGVRQDRTVAIISTLGALLPPRWARPGPCSCRGVGGEMSGGTGLTQRGGVYNFTRQPSESNQIQA